jgi:hypothetical protein
MYGFRPLGRHYIAISGISLGYLAILTPLVLRAAQWSDWTLIAIALVYVSVVVATASLVRRAAPAF